MRKKFLLDKMNMTNVADPYDTGFITGPSSQIEGSAEYHIHSNLNQMNGLKIF